MTTKNKLQVFFDSKQDDLKYILTYEENLGFFNDLLRIGRVEDLEFVLPIKLLKYADPLNLTGNYTKALKVLDEVSRDLQKLKGMSKWYGPYEESLTFLRGVCLSRLKRYREANIEFAKLLKKKNPNDNYVNWYKANRKHVVDRISTPILIFGVAGYLVLLGLEFTPFNLNLPHLQSGLLAVALLSLVVSYFLKIWIDRTTPQQERKPAA